MNRSKPLPHKIPLLTACILLLAATLACQLTARQTGNTTTPTTGGDAQATNPAAATQ